MQPGRRQPVARAAPLRRRFAKFFYGRESETDELLRLIQLSPFVTLYGKSGLGKSSMLQAGLFPKLRAVRFLPVYLRLDFTAHAALPPLAQADARLQPGARRRRRRRGAPGSRREPVGLPAASGKADLDGRQLSR